MMRTLGDGAIGFVDHRLEDGGIALHVGVILLQSQQDVFALPQVTAWTIGLFGNLGAAITAVGAAGGQQVRDCLAQDFLQLRVVGVAVEHAAGPHRLPPHLALGEVLPPGAEHLDELGIGHHPLIPMNQ